MSAILVEFSEEQLRIVLGSRVTPNLYAPPKKHITNKEINFAILIKGELRNSIGFIADVCFSNCVFKNTIDIGDYRAAGKIVFIDCRFENDVIIEAENTSFEGSCEFIKNLSIRISRNCEAIAHLSVDETLTITGTTNSHFLINNINLGKALRDQKIIIQSTTKELIIRNISVVDFRVDETAQFDGITTIENVKANELLLNLVSCCPGIHIKCSDIKKIVIVPEIKKLQVSDNCKFGDLNLSLEDLGKTDISDSRIEELTLTHTNDKDSIVNVQNMTLGNLTFKQIYNNGLITLRELNMLDRGIIALLSSNLGKTDFINCDFQNAVLEFENSKITESFFSETDFPKIVHLNKIKNPSQGQLAFGQIATAYQKQGDTVRALEYQSREISAHYDALRFWSMDFFKAFNLGLNKVSNNFGRRWFQGICFTIVAGTLFFYLLVLSSKEYFFAFKLNIDEKILSAYFKFINPLRFFETESLFRLNQEKSFLTLNGWSYFFDFFGRIVVAYGFYQTIQAFRRFGRK